MTNDMLFRALSSPTRIKILKILTQKEMHLSGLAREIGISVPVTSKHVKILEKGNLINKRIVGNVHLLSTKVKDYEKIFEPFIEESELEITKEKSLFEALKQIPGY